MFDATVIDPFATKGAEYLLVIGFLAALVLFWRFLDAPVGAAVRGMGRRVGGWFRLPAGVRLHPGHAWARAAGDGTVLVGMDDFARALLGGPDGLDLPSPGSTLRQGRRGWRVAVDGKSFDMLAPVTGEVVEVNPAVATRPGTVGEDPYGRGWLLRVRPGRRDGGLGRLLRDEMARAWLEAKENLVRRRMAGQLGFALQDGGVPLPGMARAIDPERWDDLARELLLCPEDDGDERQERHL